jgi:hypothetical protein
LNANGEDVSAPEEIACWRDFSTWARSFLLFSGHSSGERVFFVVVVVVVVVVFVELPSPAFDVPDLFELLVLLFVFVVVVADFLVEFFVVLEESVVVVVLEVVDVLFVAVVAVI